MCVCKWDDGKVISMCGAHHEAARKFYEPKQVENKPELTPLQKAMDELQAAVESLRRTVERRLR